MDFKLKLYHRKIFWALLTFLVTLVVYIFTLAPDVFFIDAGEFATALVKFNICHPTGYPLFTMLGKIFMLIPSDNKIYLANLLTTLISASSVFMFFYLCEYILNNIFKPVKISPLLINIISSCSALILAFSFTSWNTSNSVEVYSLHKFFLVTTILIFTKSINTISEKRDRYWIFFAFVVGLSFSNHMTTIFLSLGCLYYYFATYGFTKVSFKRILMMGLPFILGLSVYLVLPLRAGNAYISWGMPNNLERFINHVSGKQFSVWMFSSLDTPVKQFKHFMEIYPKEFAIVPLIFAIFGLIKTFKTNIKFFWFTILLFAFNIFYAINYDIYDIDSYFLLSFIVTTLWAAIGMLAVGEYLNLKFSDTSKATYATIILAIILPLLVLGVNYSKNDESKNYYVSDYTHNMFNSAKENSIIISSQWDFFVAPSWYYQIVKKERPDLIILDKELMKRGWYIPTIEKNYPDLYQRSKTEFDNYNVELQKFEKNTKHYTNPKSDFDISELKKIQKTYADLLTALVDDNQDKNFYVTFEVESNKQEVFANNYFRIPEGLLIRYSKTNNFDTTYKFPEYKYEITNDDKYHYYFLMSCYYSAYMNTANYLMNYNKLDMAEAIIKRAEELEIKSPANIKRFSAKQILNKIKQLREVNK